MTRRSPSVVLLDAMLGLATRVQTASLPGSGGKGAGKGGGKQRSRATIAWLVGGTLVAAGLTALLVGAVLRTPDGLTDLPPGGVVAAPATSTSTAATVPVATKSATPSATATTTPATTAPTTSPTPGKAPATIPASRPSTTGGSHLTAAYSAPGGLLGYRANVTLTSEGPDAADGWQLTVTMPRATLQLSAVSGATVKQNGTVWTFTPTDDTRQIPAGGTATVVFDVLGATLLDAKPTACAINGESCAGLS